MSLPALVYKADPRDNVGTALASLTEGIEYPVYEEGKGVVGRIRPIVPVPRWHKIALEEIDEGVGILKFGHVIGVSVRNIEAGFLVHITNVLLDDAFDLTQVLKNGFVLGTTLSRLEKGDIVRVGVNLRPTHYLFKHLRTRTKIGVAAAPVPEGGTLRIGNMIEPPPGIRISERYIRLVKDFYRFLRASFVDFTRVQV
ncbi:MAG: hypothetical protein NZ954_05215 [Thermofilaceae archaeon]|nr:hypothetical protein [Thermofilaceae archaeon]MCX8180206.1 hypothetical protein [Thermofilaceae archaeon]MDW8004138.1 hypothetical protein [Thermofilaceae archaeon]